MRIFSVFVVFSLSYTLLGAVLPRKNTSDIKQAENRKFLAILSELNDMPLSAYDTPEERKSQAEKIDEIIVQLNDPVEAARFIILNYYLYYPGRAGNQSIDSHFPFTIYYMKYFIGQSHFVEAMGLLEGAIRLDAGSGYEFDEVLWQARKFKDVRLRYAHRLERWENSILKNGSPSKKAELQAEMQERVGLATKKFLAGEQNKEKLDEYFPDIILSKNEQRLFYFNALNTLLDNPERASLRYMWKRGLLEKYIETLDLKAFKEDEVLVLFKALKVGSAMLTGDIGVVNILEEALGFNVGYDLAYLKSASLKDSDRLELLQKWQDAYLNKIQVEN